MTKSKIIITITFLVLAIGSIGYVIKAKKTMVSDDAGSIISQEAAPTEDELESGDKIKEEIVNNNSSTTDTQPTVQSNISVVVTDAQQYDEAVEVRAFVPNLITNGECTISFRQNSYTVKKTTPAYAEASSTICTNPEIKRSEFPNSGQWSLIVYFSSEKATGQSAEQKVIIE